MTKPPQRCGELNPDEKQDHSSRLDNTPLLRDKPGCHRLIGLYVESKSLTSTATAERNPAPWLSRLHNSVCLRLNGHLDRLPERPNGLPRPLYRPEYLLLCCLPGSYAGPAQQKSCHAGHGYYLPPVNKYAIHSEIQENIRADFETMLQFVTSEEAQTATANQIERSLFQLLLILGAQLLLLFFQMRSQACVRDTIVVEDQSIPYNSEQKTDHDPASSWRTTA